jgi:lipoate-protein ligase B
MKLLDLGQKNYEEVWKLQKEIVRRRAEGKDEDTLIVVEHNHVITLGRKTSEFNMKNQPIPVYLVERGGDATYHGPGQIVFYPIMYLHDKDIRRFVRMLEETIIISMNEFNIRAERLEGHRGVWFEGKKLASIGLAVENWVTYHGFALNVNTDLSYFNLIRPCGLDAGKMTSMEKILGRKIQMEEVKSCLIKSFSNVFNVSFVLEAMKKD